MSGLHVPLRKGYTEIIEITDKGFNIYTFISINHLLQNVIIFAAFQSCKHQQKTGLSYQELLFFYQVMMLHIDAEPSYPSSYKHLVYMKPLLRWTTQSLYSAIIRIIMNKFKF